MAIEIVDFPIDSMVIFHSYVNVYRGYSPEISEMAKFQDLKTNTYVIAIDVGFHIAFRGLP